MTRARDRNPVRLRREELGLLLKELAVAADCSAPMLSMVEGGYVPKPHSQLAIAAALQTTAVELWPEEYA